MRVRATVLGIGTGVGLAFGTIVLHPEAGAELLGGLLGFISVLYLADLMDKHKA
jgi:predicted polyphosphate/ATP-dependent NAD kinase